MTSHNSCQLHLRNVKFLKVEFVRQHLSGYEADIYKKLGANKMNDGYFSVELPEAEWICLFWKVECFEVIIYFSF